VENETTRANIGDQTAAPRRAPFLARVRPDVAYLLPMAAFLGLTWVGGTWPASFAITYALKTVVAAVLLYLLWSHYTKISWDYFWTGVLVGVLGVVQWIGTEELLARFWPTYPKMGGGEPFNPYAEFDSPVALWLFVAVRWLGPTLVVPVMEELFWRDFLWRSVIAPNDFKLARVGEWDKVAFFGVAAFFATVHPFWMTAIVWGLMIAGLLVWTKSLGACIVAHGVTNFLLGAYVLVTQDWKYW
jgi:CAAX prenyl protease-like protein